MGIFAAAEFDNHELVLFAHRAASGLKCIIAVHSTVLGPALGGCRMWDYASEDAALTDALRLSRGMTYKASLAGLDLGGGKAVIIGDPRRDKTEPLLLDFAGVVESLGGRYMTAEDVGTSAADMDVLRRRTRFACGGADSGGDPSPATARGVFMAIGAAVEHRSGSRDLTGVRVSVQGLGHVGLRLCEELKAAGARLWVSDIDGAAVGRGVDMFDAVAVTPEAIHALDVDVFAPCALGAVVNDATVPALKAAIVAGAANNQLAEPRHGDALAARGILYVPDYVANAGGLIMLAGAARGAEGRETDAKVEGIFETSRRILARAGVENRSTSAIADLLAEERIAAGKAATAA